MQKLSGATQLTLGLILGVLLGLSMVGVVSQENAPTPSTTSTTTFTFPTIVVHQPVYEFFAANSGVQCEIDTNLAQSGTRPLNGITCFTNEPPHRVILTDKGKIEKCLGVECLANPGLNTPHLLEDTQVVSGSHSCQIFSTGVACGGPAPTTFTMYGDGTVLTHRRGYVEVGPAGIGFSGTRASGVQCELEKTSIVCITITPPRQASLDGWGPVTSCAGVKCLSIPTYELPSNDSVGTPIDNGFFSCVNFAASVECHDREGRGFSISKAGITPLS